MTNFYFVTLSIKIKFDYAISKVIRDAQKAVYDEQQVLEILDSSFVCHVAFVHDGIAQILPTSYGRIDNYLYLHGSSKNAVFASICNQPYTTAYCCRCANT